MPWDNMKRPLNFRQGERTLVVTTRIAEQSFIAAVDGTGHSIGPVDKWEAHREGTLHRAFTVGLVYDGCLILQHRKHPLFDLHFDLTCSSHPEWNGEGEQDLIEAAIRTLQREWAIDPNDLSALPTVVGAIDYKAVDPISGLIEHEHCHYLTAEVTTSPRPDPSVAYGLSFIPKDRLYAREAILEPLLAPWVKAILDAGLV